ncbi:transposase [Streptomyces mirabilis]|uniref:transposase n=1 Tax=Streptomyces mirabilis TaxID=68239 RepID=UPI003F4BC304
MKGRKRHLITDALGLILAVIVTAAFVHDTADGIRLLDQFTIARPGVCKVWADGARLSILCILDMSRKTSPIDVSENHLFTLQPALRGLTNPQAPSLVAAIIGNGNLPISSSWSRRRSPALPGRPRSGPAWHPGHPKTSCAVVAHTRALPVRGS